MKNYCSKIAMMVVALFCATSLVVVAQNNSNQEYLKLKAERDSVAAKQDSLNNLIKSKKEAVANDQSLLESVAPEIIALETELFEVVNKLGALNSKCLSIEQEKLYETYQKENEERLAKEEAAENQKNEENVVAPRNILNHPQVEAMMSSSEKEEILKSTSVSNKADSIFEEITALYTQIDTIFQKYTNEGDTAVAYPLEESFDAKIDSISMLDSEATKVWSSLYRTKIYLYSRVLDKIGAKSTTLDYLNETARNSRSREFDIQKANSAPLLSSYKRQQRLVLEYELKLSEVLKAKDAQDSILNAIKTLNEELYDLKKITLPPQHFIGYAPITRTYAAAHTTKNPPKELDLPTRGDLYKVELGTYSKKLTTFNVLYRIAPVEYLELESGKFRYWAGSYKTLEEVEKAKKTLSQSRIRASVAYWKDGINEKDSTLSVGEYRIKLEEVSQQVRNKVTEIAPDKQIVRLTAKDGSLAYYIGIFETKINAIRVLEELDDENAELVPLL